MRRSSRGVEAGTPSEATLVRASDFLGFEPTPGQTLVKHAFWVAWREDPSVDPRSITPQDVLAVCDAPSIDKWWRDAGFRDWFLNKEEWRGKAEAALHMWLDQTIRRLAGGMLPGSELAQLGKLLADLTGRGPKAVDTGRGAKQLPPMSEAEARAHFERLALAQGWSPPAQLGSKDV